MDPLKKLLHECGQEHILQQLPDLDETHPVYQQLLRLDLTTSLKNFKIAMNATNETRQDNSIKPVEMENAVNWAMTDAATKTRLYALGMKSIAESTVAAVILSGGQGTRLGFAGPKGMYNMGLVSNKTIFQLHVERIAKIRALASNTVGSTVQSPSIPIYIMTSDLNDTIIRNYFAQEEYFGYPKEDIFFFEQGLEPCITFDGKIIVESTHSLALAPDGNGGIYPALKRSGAINDMTRRGIQHLHIYGIDNVLTRACDPAFIGVCIDRNIQCGNKVVWRANKTEKVGVTASIDGHMGVLEYSEIPIHLAEAEDETGKLVFGAANICNHYLTVSFLLENVLPNMGASYHLATKKIPCLDVTTGLTSTPSQPNGVKLELFIFDVFPLASRWVVFEVNRDDEFAPVKNEPGNPVDSPDSARLMLSNQGTKWLQSVGAQIEGSGLCEISPLLSYAGEGLEAYQGTVVRLPCYLTK